MTTKQATGIALKLFALYLLFNVVLIALPIALQVPRTGLPVWPTLLISSICMLIAGFAIWMAWKLGDRMARQAGETEEALQNNMTVDDLMKVVITCMGLYLAIHGALAFLRELVVLLNFASSVGPGARLDRSRLIVPGAQFLLGALLVARPRQWVRFLRSIGEK